MKLSIVFLILAFMQVSAASLAQKVTIKVQNANIAKVFHVLTQQTGRAFIADAALTKKLKPLSLNMEQVSLNEVLSKCFEGQKIKIIINDDDKIVVISEDIDKIISPKDISTITGLVTDERSIPIPGATVKLKNGTQSSATNTEGKFSISVPNLSSILIFTSIGYVTQEVSINNRHSINVVLKEQTTGLNEVVVLGYGSVKKTDLTGSVGQVNMGDIQKAPVATFDQALAGRIAGVQVSSSDGQPGANFNIVVRGSNSLTQSNSPLYVIDGFPMEDGINNALNPNDIESITVLKDASATAIYGARGANGVIIIETKKGKQGAPVINYNGSYGSQHRLKTMELFTPYDFVKYQLEFNSTDATTRYLQNSKTLDSYLNEQGFNWQDQLFRNASTQLHSIALRGGNKDTKYSISGSLNDIDGLIINSGFRRYQGQVSLDQTVNDKFKVGVSLLYSKDTNFGSLPSQTAAGGLASSNLLYSVWGYRPITGGSDYTQLEDSVVDPGIDNSNDYRINPVLNAQNTLRRLGTSYLNVNVYGSYRLTSDLTLKITGGINNRLARADAFNNSLTTSGTPLIPSNSGRLTNGSVIYTGNNVWSNENTLTYRKTIAVNHIIEVLAGSSFQGQATSQYGSSAVQIPNESLGLSGIDEGLPLSVTAYESQYTLASFFGRINYNYKSRYYLTGTFRADGSSKFSPANRWGYFPSGAFAWRFSEEKFVKKLNWIDDGKLRVSYGISGNNRVSDFAYLATLSLPVTARYSFNNGIPSSATIPNQLGNSDLKWENTAQLDLGTDLSFCNSRINFTADVYRKTTSNLLLNSDVPYSTGFSSVYANVGKIQNDGVEFSLSTINIQGKRFKWQSNFNISFNRNKILELSENQDYMLSNLNWDVGYAKVPLYIAKVGGPAAQFYGFLFDGIYQLSDFEVSSSGVYTLKTTIPANGNPRQNIQPGDIKYKDLNGDGVVDANDRSGFGKALPIHAGGFTNNFTYQNFSLNVFFQWSYGNDIYNANRIVFEGNGLTKTGLNQFSTYEDRWTPTNPSNTLFRTGGQGPSGVYSSRVLEDGSYLRLKTLSLAYQLDQKITKKLSFKQISFNVALQNVFTWTHYSGMDPEVSIQSSVLTPGFDYSAYPRARTIVFGINASL